MEQFMDKLLKESGFHEYAADLEHRLQASGGLEDQGPSQIWESLAEPGFDVNVRGDHNTAPLHIAVQEGDIKLAQELLQKRANVNIQNAGLMTPLHLAAIKDDENAVKLLLQNGAAIDARNDRGRTPLHLTAQHQRAGVVHVLLSNNADVSATDDAGYTPLHKASVDGAGAILSHVSYMCECRYKKQPTLTSILNVVDSYGCTPFQRSKSYLAYFHQLRGQWLAHKAHINVMDQDGKSTVDIGGGHILGPVLQFSLEYLMDLPPSGAQSQMCLSRKQTHLLNYFLNMLPNVYVPPLLQYSRFGGETLIPQDGIIPAPLLKCMDHVFSSVLSGQSLFSVVLTWPCNIIPSDEEIKRLLSLTGNTELFCHELLSSPFGKCNLASEPSKAVLSDVSEFLEKLSQASAAYNRFLHLTWKYAGSTAEDTKTGPPDEFDVLLEFPELSKLFPQISTSKINLTEAGKALLADALPGLGSDGSIRLRSLHLTVFRMLTSIFGDRSFWHQLDLSFIHFKVMSSGFALYTESKKTKLVIKFDLIPAFTSQTPEDGLYIFGGKGKLKKSSVLREIERMASYPTCAREGYILAKCIRSPFLLSQIVKYPFLSDLVDKILPSYQLKNALFRVARREHKKRSIWRIKPHEWARMIYQEMDKDNLKPFYDRYGPTFMDDMNKPYSKQAHLNYFVKRRLGQQTFSEEASDFEYRGAFMRAINKLLWPSSQNS